MRKLLAALLALTTISSPAQSPSAPAPAGPGWQKVQALHAGSSIQVVARLQSTSCRLKSVDADSLTCTNDKDIVFRRTDISTIKIPHRGRSALIGMGVGAGVGAGIGALSGKSCIAGQGSGCFLVFTRGDLAIVGGAVGGIIGAPIGLLTDFARSTVYRAP